MGYRTCYYRTFNVGRATPVAARRLQEVPRMAGSGHPADQAGRLTDTVAKVWPKAEDFGFPSEMAAFGLQFGHGLGLGAA